MFELLLQKASILTRKCCMGPVYVCVCVCMCVCVCVCIYPCVLCVSLPRRCTVPLVVDYLL